MENAIEQFRAAIREQGISPPKDIRADGLIYRFSTNGEPHDKAGWYWLRDDGKLFGSFGDWRSGVSANWSAKGSSGVSQRRGDWNPAQEGRKCLMKGPNMEAGGEAKSIWSQSCAASPDHPYLRAKETRVYGLRENEGRLLVPVTDGERVISLQYIDGRGGKRFLKGGRVSGGYFLIGTARRRLCVAEGYATAASVHEATGDAVAVAFNAGNLLPVAKKLRAAFPAIPLVFCVDDDVKNPNNPGLSKAFEAAKEVEGFVAVPDFGESRPDDATDFNDLHRHAGLEAVNSCIDRAVLIESEERRTRPWPPLGTITASLKPVPAFDPETLLPAPLRAWIMDESERMPCPPDFIAAAVLVALGSLIGTRCAIRPKSLDSWLIVPNLWGGIVGDPSSKKTPAWGAALKPLDRLIVKAREAYETAVTDHDITKVVFDARTNAIESRIKGAAKKSDQDPIAVANELRAHIDNAPELPALRRYRTNDGTVEKLGELLRDNPAGLLVLRDELVGLVAAWEKEGREGDRAFFLEAWNGNHGFDTDRIGRGHISIPNLSLSIFGGIQPDKLNSYLAQATNSLANDGMLQRFQVLVYPDPMRWEWRDREPNKIACDAAYVVFDSLADCDPLDWGAAPADETCSFAHFQFAPDAQEAFIAWSTDLHRTRMSNEDEPIIHQHLAKFDKLFPALALIFHMVDCAANGHRGPVSRAAALRAGAWCDYLESHARRCYGLLKDDGLRAAQALAKKLERGAVNDGFTLRDIRRNQWRDLTRDEQLQAALDWLEDEGWVRHEESGGTGPGSGRHTVRYRINPALKPKQQKLDGE